MSTGFCRAWGKTYRKERVRRRWWWWALSGKTVSVNTFLCHVGNIYLLCESIIISIALQVHLDALQIHLSLGFAIGYLGLYDTSGGTLTDEFNRIQRALSLLADIRRRADCSQYFPAPDYRREPCHRPWRQRQRMLHRPVSLWPYPP